MIMERMNSDAVRHEKISPGDTRLFLGQLVLAAEGSTIKNKATSAMHPVVPNYVMLDSLENLGKVLKPLHHAPVLALDTETTGLNPHCHELRLIPIAAPGHPVILVDVFKIQSKLEMWEFLRHLFQTDSGEVLTAIASNTV